MSKGKSSARSEGGRSRSRRDILTGLAILLLAAGGAFLYFGLEGQEMNPGNQDLLANYGDPRRIAAGEALYARNCASCHGERAIGENQAHIKGGTRPGGGYWAPALNGSAHAWHHPPEGLFQIVKEGSPAADSPMRGWGGRMSDIEIHAVLAYLQSLWPQALRERYEKAFLGR